MPWIVWAVIGLIVGIVIGIGVGFMIRKKIAEREISSAEEEAKRIINESIKSAESKKREALLEAKEEIHKNRTEYEREVKERRSELSKQENRLQQKEENLDKKTDALEKKTENLNKKIAEIENSHPWLKGRNITGVADPAIWDASRGESIADTALKYGIYFTPGDHQRINGWMQVRYRFQFDHNGYARMYIFDTCKAFIRTMPLMRFSETDPEDLDTALEDHCADEVRYLCMSRPVTPMLSVEKKEAVRNPLE